MLNDALLKPLELLLNRRINASMRARELLGELDGRVLAVDFAGTPLGLYFICDELNGLQLSGEYADDPDAILTGSPLSIARLASEENATANVHIAGDVSTARTFAQLLLSARPDWEEELSRLVGDVFSHQIGNAFRGAARLGQQAFSHLSSRFGDFLKEDESDPPAREEVQAFVDDVDRLQRSVKRAEKRLSKLESRLA